MLCNITFKDLILKLPNILLLLFLTIGFEIILGGFQSCNIYDHLSVNCKGDNGTITGSFVDVAD